MLKNGILAGDVEITKMQYWWLIKKTCYFSNKDGGEKETSLVKRTVKEVIQSMNVFQKAEMSIWRKCEV